MILSDGCDATVEALILGESLTPYLGNADTVVNPLFDGYYDKRIIISMPINPEVITKLSKFNRIESRIRLDGCENYSYVPYSKELLLPISAFIQSNLRYDRNFYKSIKNIMIGDKLFIEVPRSVGDLEYNGDLTFIGLINKYLRS